MRRHGWYAAAERVTHEWGADTRLVVRALAETPPAIGSLDFEHVAYIGHSLGGAASFEACRQDSQCAAAVDLDGTLWTDVRHDGLEAPSLLLQHDAAAACDDFCQRAAQDFAKVKATGRFEQVIVAGSQHMSFSDLGLISGTAAAAFGPIPPDRMILLTRDVVRTFLDVHVRHAPAASFPATVTRYPELQ